MFLRKTVALNNCRVLNKNINKNTMSCRHCVIRILDLVIINRICKSKQMKIVWLWYKSIEN